MASSSSTVILAVWIRLSNVALKMFERRSRVENRRRVADGREVARYLTSLPRARSRHCDRMAAVRRRPSTFEYHCPTRKPLILPLPCDIELSYLRHGSSSSAFSVETAGSTRGNLTRPRLHRPRPRRAQVLHLSRELTGSDAVVVMPEFNPPLQRSRHGLFRRMVLGGPPSAAHELIAGIVQGACAYEDWHHR